MTRRRGRPAATTSITTRQQQYLSMIVDGMSDEEIAIEFGVTPGAVKAAVYRACRRTGVTGRVGLELWYGEKYQ